MDLGLHAKQGINHLNRVINYAKFVAEDGAATVHLTFEDWHVLADTLFHMDTPRDMIPDHVQDYSLVEGKDAILVTTEDCAITVEMM
jgi:hypothetical protein